MLRPSASDFLPAGSVAPVPVQPSPALAANLARDMFNDGVSVLPVNARQASNAPIYTVPGPLFPTTPQLLGEQLITANDILQLGPGAGGTLDQHGMEMTLAAAFPSVLDHVFIRCDNNTGPGQGGSLYCQIFQLSAPGNPPDVPGPEVLLATSDPRPVAGIPNADPGYPGVRFDFSGAERIALAPNALVFVSLWEGDIGFRCNVSLEGFSAPGVHKSRIRGNGWSGGDIYYMGISVWGIQTG